MITLVLTIIVVLYVAANFIIYFWQEKFLFKPEKLPADFEFKYQDVNFMEYNLEPVPGVNINGVHFCLDAPKGVVLYLKGNSRSIKGWGRFAVDFTRLG